MKGRFIVFEGPEGAGKSTQIQRLQQRLQRQGLDPILTREPGGSASGDAIRQVILNPDLAINPLSEFLLYSASRAQHVLEVIQPALDANKLVISDRFTGASLAYQGYGRGLDLDFIRAMNERVSLSLKPHLTLLLDIDVKIGLQRVAARGAKDRLEQADISFHQRVRRGFQAQAASDVRWRIINAALDEDLVHDEIWEYVATCLDDQS